MLFLYNNYRRFLLVCSGVIFDGRELHYIEPKRGSVWNATSLDDDHLLMKHSHLTANFTCGKSSPFIHSLTIELKVNICYFYVTDEGTPSHTKKHSSQQHSVVSQSIIIKYLIISIIILKY